MIYIAQPPLYEVRAKGQKKSEYVLTESVMHKRLTDRGLQGTELTIRDGAGKKGAKEQKITGEKLTELVKLLVDMERCIAVLARRGIKFDEFIADYSNGKGLPMFRIRIESKDEMFQDKDDFEKRVDQLKGGKSASPKNGQGKSKEEQEEEEQIDAEELHEVSRINELVKKLKAGFGLELRDYLLKQQRAVSGEAMSTKFQLTNEGEHFDVASLGEICTSIRKIGSEGVEIKRFKGLGEMNAEQLWETTMNPATRTLLSVKLDDAGEADRLFSILMGENVEQRRDFIRDHALEVQFLDI
jgi:DNA gyrase subunit B